MFIASHYHIIVCYVNISSGGGGTQEADGVQGHLKLRTGANEGTSHWLYLTKNNETMPHTIVNHHP